MQSYCKDCQYILTDARQKTYRERHRQNVARSKRGSKYAQEPDRQKRLARKALAYAIERGHITRPDRCSSCRAKCVPHGHHPDYSRPLLVEWLCPLCHAQKHPRQRKG